jgi:DNA repair protein SbcD/Mre11
LFGAERKKNRFFTAEPVLLFRSKKTLTKNHTFEFSFLTCCFMKILHTSDWHIGHKLYGNDRTEEHQSFFKWLIKTIHSENIDVLLVCGDIFDVGYPSNMALKTYYQLLKDLIRTNLRKVIITGGNHDFVSTLEAPREILKVLNVTVVGGATENLQDEIIEIKDDRGETGVVIAAVPFLREKDIRTPVSGESANERIKATRGGIIKHYIDLAHLVDKYKAKNIPVIATGHLYMQGTRLSDSERDIHLGNQAGVAASAFPATFDYYALGHIHRSQLINETPAVIYSGSPIALSFSEQHNKKSVRIIETGEGKLSHTKLEIPNARLLKSFVGTYRQITEKLNDFKLDSSMPAWLELSIREEDYDPLLARETSAFVEEMNKSNRNFEIIRHTLVFANRNPAHELIGEPEKSLTEMSEIQVFENLLTRQGVTDTHDLIQSFKELVEMVHATEKQD